MPRQRPPTLRTRARIAVSACGWIACLLLSAAPAAAQRDRVRIDAEFGWGGDLLVADSFSPVRVTLSGAEEPLGGFLTMTFGQDATQRVRLVVPAAVTPGRPATYEFVAALPPDLRTVTFTMVDERGDRLGRALYGDGMNSRSRPLPTTPVPRSVPVVSAGRSAPYLTRPGARVQPQESELQDLWRGARAVEHGLDELPTVWAAYTGLAALVVDADAATRIDPLALEAIRTWVGSGGRLVLVADEPGAILDAWFAPDTPPVVLGGQAEHPTPPALRDVVAHAIESNDPELPEIEPLGDRVAARAVRLTAPGIGHGWRTGMATGDGADLVALGPWGSGWIIVLGCDPERMPSVISSRSAGVVWRHVLADAVAPWLERVEVTDFDRVAFFGWDRDGDEAQAIERAFDPLTATGVPIDLIFAFIVVGMFGLALAVGPVNASLLRRRDLGQFAWLASLGWITLGAAAAWIAPLALRGSPTLIVRTYGEDLVLPLPGSGGGSRWSTVATGTFASNSQVIPMEGADARGFWRGVSPLYGQSAAGAGATIVMPQANAGVDGWFQRGGRPESIAQNMWSVRTMLSIEPTSLALGVSVTREGSGWRVSVTGIPDDAELGPVLLETATTTHALPLEPAGQGWSGLTGADLGRGYMGSTEWRAEPGPTSEANALARLEAALHLPGVWQRAQAAEARIASGRWVTLHLLLEQRSGDIAPARRGIEHRTTRAVRVLVPLEPFDHLTDGDDS